MARGPVCVSDSRTGSDKLITGTITSIESLGPITPLLWSNNGQRIFAASDDSKIKCFDVSTGCQLAESQILNDGDDNVKSIALATNGSFIATYSGRTIFFLDASTLTRIGPIINESENIAFITLSPDSNYLATGRHAVFITSVIFSWTCMTLDKLVFVHSSCPHVGCVPFCLPR